MLETPEERIKLLKAGVDEKLIGELYITSNNFKIVNATVLFKVDEISTNNTAKT